MAVILVVEEVISLPAPLATVVVLVVTMAALVVIAEAEAVEAVQWVVADRCPPLAVLVTVALVVMALPDHVRTTAVGKTLEARTQTTLVAAVVHSSTQDLMEELVATVVEQDVAGSSRQESEEDLLLSVSADHALPLRGVISFVLPSALLTDEMLLDVPLPPTVTNARNAWSSDSGPSVSPRRRMLLVSARERTMPVLTVRSAAETGSASLIALTARNRSPWRSAARVAAQEESTVTSLPATGRRLSVS